MRLNEATLAWLLSKGREQEKKAAETEFLCTFMQAFSQRCVFHILAFSSFLPFRTGMLGKFQ